MKKASSLNQRVSVLEGDDMVLPCVFNGNPVPMLTWSKYLAPLPTDRTNYIHSEYR